MLFRHQELARRHRSAMDAASTDARVAFYLYLGTSFHLGLLCLAGDGAAVLAEDMRN